jgi:DNA polymerase II small subunit
VSEELREALGRIIEAGYQLSADGFKYLGTLEGDAIKEIVGQAIQAAGSSPQDITILDMDFFQNMQEEALKKARAPDAVTGKPRVRPPASDYDAQIQVLDDGPAEPSGDLEGFIDYFRSRFRSLEGILRQRMDVRDAVKIGSVLGMPLKSKVKVIGIVTSKRTSGRRLFLELEDNEDSVTVLASEGEALRKGLTVLEDQVVCVDAVKYRQDLLIANDFIWPDTPSRPAKRSEAPLCAAFIADVHVGSRYFQKELFQRFINWINLEVGPPQSRRLASHVKYVVIAGDLVDGIGIYPNQLRELEITDIHEQYDVAARMLSKLPDYVEVIVMPGNHDAVRKSLPQPPLPREYAEELCEDERVHLLGNPSHLLLNGVEVFISHGKALDDVLSQVPGMDFNNPLGGMELLLRCRHVAPTYGSSTPIAPMKEDRLIISSTPDIFQMGHIHIYGSRKYKGTTLIASGSWQEQTPFQKRVNLEPTVGLAPIVDLQTHQVTPLDLKRLG